MEMNLYLSFPENSKLRMAENKKSKEFFINTQRQRVRLNSQGYEVYKGGKYFHREWYCKEAGKKIEEIIGKHIHHIDGDKSNNSYWNLIELERDFHMDKVHNKSLPKWKSYRKGVQRLMDAGMDRFDLPGRVHKKMNRRTNGRWDKETNKIKERRGKEERKEKGREKRIQIAIRKRELERERELKRRRKLERERELKRRKRSKIILLTIGLFLLIFVIFLRDIDYIEDSEELGDLQINFDNIKCGSSVEEMEGLFGKDYHVSGWNIVNEVTIPTDFTYEEGEFKIWIHGQYFTKLGRVALFDARLYEEDSNSATNFTLIKRNPECYYNIFE
jgi:hypothetical protein